MRFICSRSTILSCICGFVLGAAGSSAARAGETHALLIAANDGYGVQDCLAVSGDCGQVVADAWCEAHGHGAAVSFGPASRFAGAVASNITASGDDYVVNCGD